jgi:CTP:molybdopterin cytidylyltransferase MocA
MLFDRTVWPELDATTGDEGARSAIDRHPQWSRLVEVEGPPPRDIDTEEDYERVRADFAARRLGSLEGPSS